MNRRLIALLLAATTIATTWAVVSFACGDKDKNTTASVVSTARGTCPYAKNANAMTADMKGSCPAMAGCPMHKANGAMVSSDGGSCAAHEASAVTASHDAASCTAYKSGAATAAHDAASCAAHKASNTTAGWETGNGTVTAVPVGANGCSHGAMKSTTMASRTGCVICDENVSCNERLTMAGAVTQVVPLKNGVMYVYTANVEGKTHAVQSAVHRRNDRIAEIASTGGDVPLCDGCKAMRGAMASGKLHREVVNIEGGSLTLVTSDDPEIIQAIQEYSGLKSLKS